MPQTQVYPRWRGEHISSRTRASFRLGLSPLARGTHTPLSNSCDLPTVYPRWRGEHIDPEQQYAQTDGLSPLARGTRIKHGLTRRAARFIPAGAGNTSPSTPVSKLISVYPRWRGEHKICCKTRCKNSGLSPLARGTPPPVRLTPAQRRFIPAGAGNTRASTSSGIMIPVYPRWRGEHSKHNLLLINDFLSQSQSTNFIVSHKQHIHYVKEHLIH
ncbi:Domain of uncharacterised function (DUF2825) [Escherichia coli]|nr:Domain of uncharacterised function (DUF2825) [Escherichia coli]